jgi:LmbE family N-acetylglucosaminyl deacetylase
VDGSSFSYKRLCGDGGLMVVVPHEDDEINLAGALIYGARKEGVSVKCVFMTNGDAEYPAKVRLQEAIRALAILGVQENDIIFLGYPDSGRYGERSVLLHTTDEIVKAGAQKETYGISGHPDFAMQEKGASHECSWNHLLNDMEEVIAKYHPSTIAACDFDYHPDHRMCYLAFTEVMNRLLHKETHYRPLILMGYCYTTGFDSVSDFYGRHLLSTVVNKGTLRNKYFETENPTYDWGKRIRLPVMKECRTWLAENVLFKALCAHLSQKALRRAVKLVNGDEVFWLRRTDNLAYEGMMTASSGNPNYLDDFHMINTKDIISEEPAFQDYLWIPDCNDKGKWCQCTFSEPQHVEALALYGNIETGQRILRGRISFSNGNSFEAGPLAENGKQTLITFPAQDDVKWIRFHILETEGEHAGVSEWEIFKSLRMDTEAQVLQIIMDGNFAYDWHAYPGENPHIGVYRHGISGEIEWTLNGKNCTHEEVEKKIRKTASPFMIRASIVGNPGIFSEIEVKPAEVTYRLRHLFNTRKDQLAVWWENQREKYPHHQLRKLKK